MGVSMRNVYIYETQLTRNNLNAIFMRNGYRIFRHESIQTNEKKRKEKKIIKPLEI